ncbi:hypothetical protein ACHQM5_021730 [Ranunculus cassubicifolius]
MEVDAETNGLDGSCKQVAGMSGSLDGVACSTVNTSSKGEAANVIVESVVTEKCETECQPMEINCPPAFEHQNVDTGVSSLAASPEKVNQLAGVDVETNGSWKQVAGMSGSLDGVACSIVNTSLKGEAANVIVESVVTEKCETECQAMEVDCPPASEHQNVDTKVSSLAVSPEKVNQLAEVDVETKGLDGSCKETDQIKSSDTGSIIIDLDASLGADSKEADGKVGFNRTVTDGYKKQRPAGKDMSNPTELTAGIEETKESEFAVSDLVWGKVKSHPWWPGQIFDPSFASKKAMKHYKKERLLVAYFGDQTFAWNEPSSLKPFKVDFPDMEKQTDTLVFQDALYYALSEVSRQVELGLSCICTPEDVYAARKFQTVNNAGIKEEVCKTEVVDRQFSVTSFDPADLLEYIKVLALGQSNGGDRLKTVISQAQLVAFYSRKGYLKLPEFHVFGLSDESPVNENKEETSIDEGEQSGKLTKSVKRQIMLEDESQSRKKQRNLTDLADKKKSSSYSENGLEKDGNSDKGLKKSASGKKRKSNGSCPSDSVTDSKKQKATPKSSVTPSPSSRASKIGERILGIAKHLSGSPPILKHSAGKVQKCAAKGYRRSKKLHEVDDFSPDVMLSQLCLAAKDPTKGYSFLTSIIDFFTGFRNSINLDNESYDHEAMSDSEKDDDSPSERETSPTLPSDSNPKSEKDVSSVGATPTALVLKFTDADSIPSESDLNKIFRPIGSLEESQTEILRKSRQAKVVFYRSSDADQAFRKYVKFKDFGPALVSYELQPETPTKSLFTARKCRRGAATSVEQIRD